VKIKGMTRGQERARRSYGSGPLFVKTDAAGVEHWYGQWRLGGRLTKGLARLGGGECRGSGFLEGD
jgi:hypothetical protein